MLLLKRIIVSSKTIVLSLKHILQFLEKNNVISINNTIILMIKNNLYFLFS